MMDLKLASVLLVLVAIGAAQQPPLSRPWMDVTADPETRATALLNQMTLDEKIIMLHGSGGPYVGNVPANTRLGIPALNLNDGPQGFRPSTELAGTSTCWPSMMTVAASFDQDAMLAYGTAMGKEFFLKGANVQLGPGVCVCRVPVNGRTFEYISGEDPFLGYTMVQPAVRGIQSQGVIANAKHYVNNNQATNHPFPPVPLCARPRLTRALTRRMHRFAPLHLQETNRGSVSENVDERTQFEIYYPPFQGAIEAGVGSFMCSYNKIRDTWSCENNQTLGTDLKVRMNKGQRFWVMSDWGATHSTSINQGLDQEMPSSNYMGASLTAAVQAGTVSMATVNNSVLNILVPMFSVGLFDTPNTNPITANVTSPAHNALARNLSAVSQILLKNDNNLLPLSKSIRNIVVVGSQADAGTTVHGGGSGQVYPPYVITPLQGIRSKLGIPASPAPVKSTCSQCQRFPATDFYQASNPSAPAKSADDCCQQCFNMAGCNVWSYVNSTQTCWFKATADGKVSNNQVDSGVLAEGSSSSTTCNAQGQCITYILGTNETEVVNAVANADVAIVAVATTSSEGSDRSTLALADVDNALISLVAAHQPRTVVNIVCPGAVLTPWAPDVEAIVVSFMPGQEFGNALADVLFGDVNPSGRLPITFPNVDNEIGFTVREYPGLDNAAEAYYDERLLIGYRWYDYHNITPAFPFGHGLSYTTFSYSNLRVSPSSVSVDIQNVGARAGAEVAQLYLGFPAGSGEPPKQLKGFTKLTLSPGQKTTVTFPLASRDKSIWDVSVHDWQEQRGTFTAFVGASSRDIRVMATFIN